MLYWLEIKFGSKFARKKAKVLHQKDIEACKCTCAASTSMSTRLYGWTLLSTSLVQSPFTASCGVLAHSF